MGRNNADKSLKQQVKEILDSKLSIGESKYIAKRNGTYTEHIYSWETYRTYLKHACYFVRWCKEQPIEPSLGHKPRTVAECRTFVEKWIQHGIDCELSAYTLKLELAALAKLYGCKSTDFNIKTPPRKRKNITRSRGDAIRDKHFSIQKNQNMITFCMCTGLRRAELAQIRGTDLIVHEGKLCLDIRRGSKGGRLRISPVVGSDEEIELVKRLCADAGDQKIFPHPSSNADIHFYRGQYAMRVYELYERDYEEYKNERLIVYKNNVLDSYMTVNGKRDSSRFPELYVTDGASKTIRKSYRDVSGTYYCRNDLKSRKYDRKAMFEASKALGHHRESIFAVYYALL